ncbi:RAD50 DNA repair-related [Cryptosporidium sp. chipmunk genotype I]|uniref:RAD50 DNA repair-related n=1 Tax=Cryptosporidium sp. chipmunk genotype I TaxID=1280935 RepID=UPI00351A6F16|nr:RAD50 DNA repair-related [Cryptosporidium sp. chipmunk genotype I]
MSSLDKLVICGVRSFSPDRREGIAFESPITLIVGQNGSGKTTIIECLKASISGELPPSSKSGQYFIHDPKLNGSAEVRAQIRLIFREFQNRKKIQVVRSFQLSHIRTRKADLKISGDLKPQFKVLESVLQTKDEESGQVTSISHKCADINTQVPILFGVSNSIIENVLFCHQEDSNWPLQDMAKVKKKFDELFGSTRYSKALEFITKLKGEYNKKIKEKALFNENLKQKIDFLKGIINKKNQCLLRKTEINKEMQTLASKLNSHLEAKQELMRNIDILDRLRAELTSELILFDTRVEEIKEIENNLLKSNYKLKDELEINSILHNEKEEIQSLNSKLKNLQDQKNQIRNNLESFKANSSVEEFNQRKNELLKKIPEIKKITTSTEILLFLENSLATINKQLINYKDLNWETIHKAISKVEVNKTDIIYSITNLKKELNLKVEEKKKLLESINNKKDEQIKFQRDLDKISEQIKDKAQLDNELNLLKFKIQENKNIIDANEKLFSVDYLKNTYNHTYNLGSINGELTILERIKSSNTFNNKYFEFDENTKSFNEMIERRKTEYNFKKIETLNCWKELERIVGDYAIKNDVSVLEFHHNLLLEKLEKFPFDMEDQQAQLKGSLGRIEIELLIIDENIQRLEFEIQEITNKIQFANLEINNLEDQLYKKKEFLTNSIKELKQDFEFLFANRKNFDTSNEDVSNKGLIQYLFTIQEEEAKLNSKIIQSNQIIEELNSTIKLINKQKQFESSKKNINTLINNIYSLVGISKLEYSTETDYDRSKNFIQELYLKKKDELDIFQNEIEKIRCEISKLKGEYKVNDDWLDKFTCDSKGYSSVEELSEKYLIGVFEQQTMSLCVKDLEKYHKSLQKALMKFHIDKMTEINRTIKELWNITYKGHDIDYIAIRSDAEDSEENLTVESIKKSSRTPSGAKSFNYRVVMVQNGVELDMKGRCSAGQKVLACIIIRLALAESFCVNCGILALDEPTTNLDRFNIKGLAEALSYLIKFRKQQKNFQLIIITHDENFVRIMAQAQQCDHFFHVSKDEQGYSTIRQVDFHGY